VLHTGKPVNLPEEAEEVAGFYGTLLETPHAEDAVFNKNFFKDWLEVLKRYPPVRLLPLRYPDRKLTLT
jgi:DNA topoisomerase I